MGARAGGEVVDVEAVAGEHGEVVAAQRDGARARCAHECPRALRTCCGSRSVPPPSSAATRSSSAESATEPVRGTSAFPVTLLRPDGGAPDRLHSRGSDGRERHEAAVADQAAPAGSGVAGRRLGDDALLARDDRRRDQPALAGGILHEPGRAHAAEAERHHVAARAGGTDVVFDLRELHAPIPGDVPEVHAIARDRGIAHRHHDALAVIGPGRLGARRAVGRRDVVERGVRRPARRGVAGPTGRGARCGGRTCRRGRRCPWPRARAGRASPSGPTMRMRPSLRRTA